MEKGYNQYKAITKIRSSIKNLLLIGITAFLLFNGSKVNGQSDTTRSPKIKFDWEIGPPGAGVNFSIQNNKTKYFGIGVNVLYPIFVLVPGYVNKESEPYTWDYVSGNFFLRHKLSKRVIFEYSLKYSYSHFGCIYCEPEDVQLYGFQFASIFGSNRVRYKPKIAVTRSVENPTFFIYIMPLVFNFKL